MMNLLRPHQTRNFLPEKLVAFLYRGISLGKNLETTRSKKKKYRNIYDSKEPDFIDFLKWRWARFLNGTAPSERTSFALADADREFLKTNRTRTTLTWIGHATLLLQLNGKNILTDPHFSKRASPVQWAGPRRVVAPALGIQDLPPIDVVVISHNHYDSLDRNSIISLFRREVGQDTLFFVPLGLSAWFKRLGISLVFDLDWWDQREAKGLKVIAVPVQHWSVRVSMARNTSLWAGWIVQSKDFKFFFAGDSGYTPLFKEIGRRFGPFDLSALPIGAYEPRWFMRSHHMNPDEAVQVHLDVRSKKSVAIHWGTFILTDEPLDEPPKKLNAAMKKLQIPQDDFVVLQHGESILLPESAPDKQTIISSTSL
jgi:L-ascorbate metabolism protein UlaG (beta-lactamase superfamily)